MNHWTRILATWMEDHPDNLHCRHPRAHKFLLWVLSPSESGEHLGLRNWWIWATRK